MTRGPPSVAPVIRNDGGNVGIKYVKRFMAAAAAVAMVGVSACGAPPTSQSDEQQNTAPSSPPPPPPVEIASVDHGNVEGLTEASFDAHGVTTTIPVTASSRLLTAATMVVKDKMLRNAAHVGAESDDVSWQLVASSPEVVGVMLTQEQQGGEAAGTSAGAVWLDAVNNEVVGSAALIDETQWSAFLDLVREVAVTEQADAEAIIQALSTPAAPYGDGPAMAFESSGNLVLRVAGEELVDLRIEAESVDPMLSEFGRRAQQAATSPQAFTGAPPAAAGDGAETPTPAPEETPDAPDVGEETPGEQTPGAETPGEQTPGAETPDETPVAQRPSVRIGPDCENKSCVALTYDDGPGPRTPEILEQIAQHGGAATFFQLGQVLEQNTDVGQQIVAQGQEVGGHSWSHPDLRGLSAEGVTEEIRRTNDLMTQTYGQEPLIMRPPYGAHNQSVDEIANQHGLALIQWNVDSQDWQTHSAASTTAAAVGAAEKTSAIVLMHDIHDATIEASAEIYRQLAENPEVEMVTVSELGLGAAPIQQGHAYCSSPAEPQEGFDCAG